MEIRCTNSTMEGKLCNFNLFFGASRLKCTSHIYKRKSVKIFFEICICTVFFYEINRKLILDRPFKLLIYSQIAIWLSHMHWITDWHWVLRRRAFILVVMAIYIDANDNNDYKQYHHDRDHDGQDQSQVVSI